MISSMLRLKLFTVASAVLLGGVAVISLPSRALAGDDAQPCPGTRCTGRQLPLCCSVSYMVGTEMDQDFYYFPNAS